MTIRSRSLASITLGAALGVFALTAGAQQAAPPKERAAADAAFARADANADGKLSKEEAARLPSIAAKFGELDRDQDGSLSPDEFAAAYAPAPAK